MCFVESLQSVDVNTLAEGMCWLCLILGSSCLQVAILLARPGRNAYSGCHAGV